MNKRINFRNVLDIPNVKPDLEKVCSSFIALFAALSKTQKNNQKIILQEQDASRILQSLQSKLNYKQIPTQIISKIVQFTTKLFSSFDYFIKQFQYYLEDRGSILDPKWENISYFTQISDRQKKMLCGVFVSCLSDFLWETGVTKKDNPINDKQNIHNHRNKEIRKIQRKLTQYKKQVMKETQLLRNQSYKQLITSHYSQEQYYSLVTYFQMSEDSEQQLFLTKNMKFLEEGQPIWQQQQYVVSRKIEDLKMQCQIFLSSYRIYEEINIKISSQIMLNKIEEGFNNIKKIYYAENFINLAPSLFNISCEIQSLQKYIQLFLRRITETNQLSELNRAMTVKNPGIITCFRYFVQSMLQYFKNPNPKFLCRKQIKIYRRYTKFSQQQIMKFRKNSYIYFLGFLTFSKQQKFAHLDNFSCIFEIQINQFCIDGFNIAIDLSNISPYPNQKQVLIAPFQIFQISELISEFDYILVKLKPISNNLLKCISSVSQKSELLNKKQWECKQQQILTRSQYYIEIYSQSLKQINSQITAANKIIAKYQVKTVQSLKQYDSLSLDDCKLTCLPRQFRLFKLLKILNISHNPLKVFPLCIFDMLSLETLEMMNCELTALPQQFGNLMCNLEILQINQNNIIRLPESFINLKKLQSLMISEYIESQFSFFEIIQPLKRTKPKSTLTLKNNLPEGMESKIIPKSKRKQFEIVCQENGIQFIFEKFL